MRMDRAVIELRRQYRAARALAALPDLRARIEAREARALAAIAPVIGPEPVTVPGYRVWRDATGAVHAIPVEPTNAAQLALWREMMAGTAPQED